MATQHHNSSKSKKKAGPEPKKPEAKKASAPVKAGPKPSHKVEAKPEAKTEAKKESKPAQKAAPQAQPAPAGAKAIGPADFVITRKWSGKEIAAKAGQSIRVELPENALRGMSWQLQKLPQGVHLAEPEVKKADGMTQNRIFNFSVEEEGDYLLQFHLGRFGGQMADSFRVKVTPKAD